MPEVTYEIVRKIGAISRSDKGWSREVNLISWNRKSPKIDIRDWSPDHEKMGKGITLSDEEARKLIEILQTEI